MNRGEFNREIAATMVERWPRAPLPDATLDAYFADLAELDVEPARAALDALYREGREFPPTGAQVAKRAEELGRGGMAETEWERRQREWADLIGELPELRPEQVVSTAVTLRYRLRRRPTAAEVRSYVAAMREGEEVSAS